MFATTTTTVDVNTTLTFFGGLLFVSIIVADISILHLLDSSFTPLLSCVPPPSLPIFRRGPVIFGVVTIATSVTTTVSVSLLPPPYSV
jgi:hypothetical protein